MIIDRSNYLPVGAVPATERATGEGVILMYFFDKHTNHRIFPLDIPKKELERDTRDRVTMPDIVHNEPPVVSTTWNRFKPGLYELFQDCYGKNKQYIGNGDYPQKDIVIICGAGPSLEKDIPFIKEHRDKACVVTVNRAQNQIAGDYYVGLDSYIPIELSGTEQTQAVLATTIYPDVVHSAWKSIGFYTHKFPFEPEQEIAGLPAYFCGSHVTFDAFQFAIKQLKAKKIIFTGCDYQDKPRQYCDRYWHARNMEALAFFASRAGIEVWNASMQGVFANGVLLGSMEEAFYFNPHERIYTT